MNALTVALVCVQALGAFIGAMTAVLAEFAYIRALQDGHLDRAERHHIDALARGLYVGMSLLLTASLGLVILAYQTGASVQPALTASYWSFVALALLVITVSYQRSRGRISFSLGSAAVFTAWWFLAYLALGQLPLLSFGASIACYVIATGFFYGLLHMTRHMMTPQGRKASGTV